MKTARCVALGGPVIRESWRNSMDETDQRTRGTPARTSSDMAIWNVIERRIA
jgi:hypothetical protein